MERYHLDAADQLTYEAAFRQCLRCERRRADSATLALPTSTALSATS